MDIRENVGVITRGGRGIGPGLPSIRPGSVAPSRTDAIPGASALFEIESVRSSLDYCIILQ